jgi:hypothetical protein
MTRYRTIASIRRKRNVMTLYARLISHAATMLLVILFGTRLFAQSEKLVSVKAPDGRTYTTICTGDYCEIQETRFAIDLVDPQYVHDRKKERKNFCKAKRLKYRACSLGFQREETIQGLLLADGIVSTAGGMSPMTRRQAEQLVDEIQDAGRH